jgi:hypothetical protein
MESFGIFWRDVQWKGLEYFTAIFYIFRSFSINNLLLIFNKVSFWMFLKNGHYAYYAKRSDETVLTGFF